MTMLDDHPARTRASDDDRKLLEPFQAELRQLRVNDASRLNRMSDARQLVSSFRRELGGSAVPSDYGRNPVPAPGTQRLDVRLPYLLATTVKHTHRAAGVLPDVHVDRADSSSKERWRQSVLERFLAVCYEHSDAELQVAAAAWDASVTGAGAFECAWKHDQQVGCYYARDAAGIVVVPDPYTVWPYVRAYRSWLSPLASVKAGYAGRPIDPLDMTLGSPNVEGLVPVDGSDHVTGEMVQINQLHDDTQCLRWSGDVLLHRSDHGAGVCPVVVFPNLGPQRMIYGYADVEMCQDIAIYYQWLFSRQADVVAFAARGAYMEEQTGVPAAQVADVIRRGGVLPIRRDGKIEPIQAANQPPFVNEHLNAARTSLNDLSFTPEAAWGGNARTSSGSERGMQLLPQVELAREKQVNLGWGLEKVNELLLRMAEKQALGTSSYRGRQRRDGVTRSFAMQLGPAAQQPDGYQQQPGEELETRLPKLIEADYATDVVFTEHLDVWDPQYVLSELNKFGQAAQSLRTTLERLGCPDPDEEIKLIQSEAEEMPWIRNGMIALIEQQLQAHDQGAEAGGAQQLDQGAAPGPQAGLDTLASQGGSANAGDALTRSLNGAADLSGGRASGAPAGQIGGAPPGGASGGPPRLSY